VGQFCTGAYTTKSRIADTETDDALIDCGATLNGAIEACHAADSAQTARDAREHAQRFREKFGDLYGSPHPNNMDKVRACFEKLRQRKLRR
jgi:hypothetical protein